jgi:uncharacterized spore protein YtfJ
MKVLDQIREVVGGGGHQVFGEPYAKNGVTVIPVAKVRGGGGGGEDGGSAEGRVASGGGFGLDARPAGAFVVKGDDVSWLPAIDVNRIILGAQLVAIVALLSWRSVAKARARHR